MDSSGNNTLYNVGKNCIYKYIKFCFLFINFFFRNLTTNKMNVNALLTKYARCSIINGIKYYSSKYGK